MVFWFETIFFSRKRWFSQEKTSKNHLFLEKKMVSNQKDHLFLEKTKKTIFWRPQPHSFGKDVFLGFFWFSREKDGFLLGNHLFLEKKMVLSNHPSKTHLFLEKRWFYHEKTSNPLGIA